MATVNEMPNPVLSLSDPNSVIVWPGVTGPRYGTYTTFADRSFDDGAGFSEVDWESAIQAARALADRHGIPNVYVARNLR